MNFLDPITAVQNLGVQQGMNVADFGSGAGHFVLALATEVGRQGRVYAVDVRRDMLEIIEGHIRMNGIFQVVAVCADLEQENGSTLEPGSLDYVLCSNILHQVQHPENVIQEVSRVLKKDGKMVILEWEAGSFLSPKTLFTKERAEKLSKKHHFQNCSTIEAGDHHYGLVCSRT